MQDYKECHTYVEHLMAEHRRLHDAVHKARGVIMQGVSADHPPTAAEIVRVLHHIREELRHHFAEEEAGGCLDEAICRCPSLSSAVRTIEAEHPQLLNELEALITSALRYQATGPGRANFQAAFEQFRDRLFDHEAAENFVLRRAFGTNFNGDERQCS